MWKFNPDGTLVALSQEAAADAGVWVPSESLVFHRAELPPGRQKVWEQTVAFALEEQLIAPVDEQHFAIGRDDGGLGGVPVAVVSMQDMEAWLGAVHEKELKPRAVWPDVLAVPFEEGRSVLWHEGGRCLLRLGRQAGVAGSLEWIASLLDSGDDADAVRVFSDDAAALPEVWRERAESLPGSLDERMLAGPDPDAAAMNLLQGAFSPVSALRVWGGPWRWAAAVVVAAVVLHIASLAAEIRIMTETTVSLTQTTNELYKQHFPEQTPLTDMRLQVRQRMRQVEGGVVKREASPWQTLLRVEPVISSCKACRVEELEFEQSSVLLVLSSSAKFDALLQGIGKIKEIGVDSEPLPDAGERKQLRLKLTMEKTI